LHGTRKHDCRDEQTSISLADWRTWSIRSRVDADIASASASDNFEFS